MLIDSGNYIKWVAQVVIDGVNVSSRLTGSISVTAGEDAARVATLSLIPASAADLASYEGLPIVISVALSRGASTETYTIFTGMIESRSFSASDHVATLQCRDAWQEIQKYGTTPEEVEALFSGVSIQPCQAMLPWSETQPDAGAYFNGLLATALGATAIDSNGTWQAIPWTIGTPDASFTADDIYDGSMVASTPNYSEQPSQIIATLAHRVHRLHCAEVALEWVRVEYTQYVVDGVPTLPKSTVIDALAGLSDWYIKGSATLVEPIPGAYPVIVGPSTVYYLVSYEQASITCDSLTATMYRRWYQDIENRYSIAFDVGGIADPVIVTQTLQSDFDASAWESAKQTNTVNAIYSANWPYEDTTSTGFESLVEPHPPTNAAIDYTGSQTEADIQAAMNYVAARGLRQATLSKRKQTIKFDRPIDPRFEIGSVISIAAYGVSGTGQVVELSYDLDLDSGDASSSFTLACPTGTAADTTFSAPIVLPIPDDTHALTMPYPLDNQIGAATWTPVLTMAENDQLVGFLCNVLPTSDNYLDSAPVYNTQFRIVMPEIVAAKRDPLIVNIDVMGSHSICNGALSIAF